MTGPEQPRTATAALREVLELFHAELTPGAPAGVVVHSARTDDVPARLNELAALERTDNNRSMVLEGVTDILTAVRTELARAREQRDRALDLAGAVLHELNEHGIVDAEDAEAWTERLDRLRRQTADVAGPEATG